MLIFSTQYVLSLNKSNSIQLVFFAETGIATKHCCDVILIPVLKVGMQVTAESFPGEGRVGCWLKAQG